jgi:hypothetical protein
MPDIIELTLRMSDRTDPQLSQNTRSGGVAINGSEQIISPLSARWTFSAVFPIRNAGDARTIRRAKSKLKGRFNHLLLRVCDQYRISRRDVEAYHPEVAVSHSDGASFSDGTGYARAQPKSPVMLAASLHATEIVFRASDLGNGMTSGVFVSINDRLYHIDDWELDGTNYVAQISPPLRAAITTSDEVDFDAKCLWRLVSDDEGQLQLSAGRLGAVTLNLVEPI